MKYESEYKDAKIEAIKFIKREDVKINGNKKNKILNLQSPYGSGKSYLIKDIKETLINEKINNKIIIYDQIFSSTQQIDFTFKIKSEKNFFKRLNKIQKENEKLSFFWKYLLPILLVIVPIIISIPSINKNFLWMLFFLLIFFPIQKFWFWLKNKFTLWNKKVIIIFENIDRFEWDLIKYIFSYSYNFSHLEKKGNFVIIFSYDSEKIKEKYKEKYGFYPKEISDFLEKYTDQIINMLDYNEEASRKIKEKMIKENKNVNENFEFSKFIIENHFFNNLRLFNRTLYFLSKNNKLIKMLDLNINICFVMYYLSIYDLKIFNFIRNDIFPDIPFDPYSFFKDEKEKDEKIELKKYDDKKIDEFIVNFFNEYIFINLLENHNDFYDKNKTTYLQYLQKMINDHIIKNVNKEQFNEMKKYYKKNINEKLNDLIEDKKIEGENKVKILLYLWENLSDENKYVTLFKLFDNDFIQIMNDDLISKIKQINFRKIENPSFLKDFLLYKLKYVFFIYLNIDLNEKKAKRSIFKVIEDVLKKLKEEKEKTKIINFLKHIFIENKFMEHYNKIIKTKENSENKKFIEGKNNY